MANGYTVSTLADKRHTRQFQSCMQPDDCQADDCVCDSRYYCDNLDTWKVVTMASADPGNSDLSASVIGFRSLRKRTLAAPRVAKYVAMIAPVLVPAKTSK